MRTFQIILCLTLLSMSAHRTNAQDCSEVLPKILQHAEVTYPPLARQTNIQGDVRVKITTDGHSVLEAVAEDGNPLLRAAAVDSAKSWIFAPHTPGSFRATFRYKLLFASSDAQFLPSPVTVEIVASPPELSIYYAWLGLGTWKAQLRSKSGASMRVFKFYFSGPDGDWLKGDASGPKGESEEIDFGHKQGDYVAFTMKLSQSGGRHRNTFLVGKIIQDKIIGTFVDDAGITGQWTAVRLPRQPGNQ